MSSNEYTTFDDMTAELDNFIDQIKEVKKEIRSIKREVERNDEVEHTDLRIDDYGTGDTATLRVSIHATEINYSLDNFVKERECDVEFSPEGQGPVESKATYRIAMSQQLDTHVEL